MSDDRNHLPPPPLGYRWETDIRLHENYAGAGLVPNSWAHLNPGRNYGFGSHMPDGTTPVEAYQHIVMAAWIGVDVQRDLEKLRSQHD